MSTPDLASESVATPATGIPRRLCECGCGHPLTSRQKRFASGRCRSAWWDREHPRIGRGPEGPREGTILRGVMDLMQDGAWRTALEIADAVRAREHSVSARLSQIRRRGELGLIPWTLESDGKVGNSRRAHRFRLVPR